MFCSLTIIVLVFLCSCVLVFLCFLFPVYFAMIHIQKQRKDNEFFEIIAEKPLARNLFVSYCQQNENFDLLKAYYFFFRMRPEAAETTTMEAYNNDRWKDRMAGLSMAEAFFGQDKDCVLEHQVIMLVFVKQIQLFSSPHTPTHTNTHAEI
jgi:hypothetical protein